MDFEGKQVVVLGAGISGIAVARLTNRLGAKVVLSDASSAEKIKYNLETLRTEGVGVALGKQEESLLDGVDYLIVSPGIPIGIALILEAKARGILVMSEIEVAYRLCRVPLYAVTGTNGKTTTTTLLGELMKTLGTAVGIGGNIGVPLSEEAVRVGESGCVVAEVSSYQLEGIVDFRPRIAAILNITPDHLARHGSVENYQKVKETIFAKQTKNDYLVLNYDDEAVRQMAERAGSTILFFSRLAELKEGVFVKDGWLTILWKGQTYRVCATDEVKIKGAHNLENALAAIAVAFLAGVEISDMAVVLKSFLGVEHRIEMVTTLDGVPYYNDSKATNPESTIKALESFAGHIILIAGGHDKHTDLTALMDIAKEKADHLILVGDAAARFKEAALKSGIVSIHETGYSMEAAVKLASELARFPQVVLLSPACASYDMFDGYEERGRVFKALVHEL